jgi:putative transposase
MDTVIKAHKIRLNPTPEQAAYFWRAAGVARFCFNWGLAEYNRRLEAKEKVSGRLLREEFNAIKAEQFPWASEVTSWAMVGAFDDLEKSFRNFFNKHKKGLLKPPAGWKPRKDGKPFGWPRFKSRHKSTPAFYIHNAIMHFSDSQFWFDKARVGWVNMAEPLRFDGKVMGGRIVYRAGHWWLSVQVEVKQEVPGHNDEAVGVDLGVKYLAVTSDGQIFENPKATEQMKRKLRRLQRSFARMEKGGKNWLKMKEKIAKLHYKIACIRDEASHQMTTQIARDYGIIGVETLNVKGMVKNRHLAKAVSDAAMFEKRRQLEYKAAWNGGIVVPVGQWFCSSKACNVCGWIKADLKLSDREWPCEGCGTINHRDGNAALNIRDEALRILGEG